MTALDLHLIGWDDTLAAAAAAHDAALAPARVTVAHRGAYEIATAEGPAWAELRGKDYFEARDKRALPTVGDWVLVRREGGGLAIIEALLPRRSVLVRAAAGERVEPQPIAANVDVAFVVTSANQDLNPRRLERYLATAEAGGVAVVIVVNKLDLVDDPEPVLARAAAIAGGRAVVGACATRGDGVDALLAHLGRGRTGVMIGSSGVGKSTLLNGLLGRAVQDVQPVRDDDDRGRHTTTRRELFLLGEGGAAGVLIDTPGMRELKPWADDDAEADEALAGGFDDVTALAAGCKFRGCTHDHEPGCAVRDAVARGALPAERLASWGKLQREQASEVARRDEAGRREERRRGKILSRAIRAHFRDKDHKK